MLPLPNNCHIGAISVSPKDWKTKGAPMTDWEISYRFHDPAYKDKYPYGFQVKRKGMNHIKNLDERRKETKGCIESEILLLKDGYNPITKRVKRNELIQDVNPYTPFLSALEYARNEVKVVPKMKANMKSQLGFLRTAAIQLNYLNLGISEIKVRHVWMLLNKVIENNPTDNNSRFNKFRTNLHILFKFLAQPQFDIIDNNPVSSIEKKPEVTKVREVLTQKQRHEIEAKLKEKGLESFCLYNQIFFYFGGHSTELLKVKGKDVDLKGQWVTITMLKRKTPERVRKTIQNVALPLWEQALKDCGPDDYLFSKGLVPGKLPIDEAQIYRRWVRHVKKPKKFTKNGINVGGLGINIDHYSFKHANTTEVVDKYGFDTAGGINSHKGTAMVKKIYDVRRDEREHENIKEVDNRF